MKKKILMAATVITVFATIMCACANNNTPTSPNNTEQSEAVGKIEVIVNPEEKTDDWWDSINEENSIPEFGYTVTNRDVWNMQAMDIIGNLTGKLSVSQMDFSVPIVVSNNKTAQYDEYYLLVFKNNDLLFPQELKTINDKITESNNSSLRVAFMKEDLMPYDIFVNIKKIPNGLKLLPEQWTILEEPYEDHEDGSSIVMYYPFSNNLCISLSTAFMKVGDGDDCVMLKEDMMVICEKIKNIISVEPAEQSDAYVHYYGNDVKLVDTENVTKAIVKLTDAKIVNWDSGARALYREVECDNHIILLNQSGYEVKLTEFSTSKFQPEGGVLVNWNMEPIDTIDSYLTKNGIEREEYLYKDTLLYVCKEINENSQNKYSSIFFEIGGTSYMIEYNDDVDMSVKNIDQWIDNMIAGIITFV